MSIFTNYDAKNWTGSGRLEPEISTVQEFFAQNCSQFSRFSFNCNENETLINCIYNLKFLTKDLTSLAMRIDFPGKSSIWRQSIIQA